VFYEKTHIIFYGNVGGGAGIRVGSGRGVRMRLRQVAVAAAAGEMLNMLAHGTMELMLQVQLDQPTLPISA
jgi:hypothetical protein